MIDDEGGLHRPPSFFPSVILHFKEFSMKLFRIFTAIIICLVSFPYIVTVGTGSSLIDSLDGKNRDFRIIETDDKTVYFHQRMIDDAVVEKDYILYQFDRDTNTLLDRKMHWRDDLPVHLPQIISRHDAESLVDATVLRSGLYYISPESDVFPLNPPPHNPCWVVRTVEAGMMEVWIIDAVEGRRLGYGLPPPFDAFSFSGSMYFYPCDYSWSSWSHSARSWFDTMGYSCEGVEWPTESQIRSHVSSHETAMFYEIAHGGSSSFASGCSEGYYPEYTYSSEIQSWISGYEKMPFAFIASCDGMCYTYDNTFSYEFRKGSTENTATVGYCGMSHSYCDLCWVYSLNWQNTLFDYMSQGYSVKYAFDQANADYPACADGNCMRFAGDETFAVFPPVKRNPQSEYIIDNVDAHFVILSGDWNSRIHSSAYGGDTCYNRPGTGEERAGWRVDTLVPEGCYEVYLWKFEHPLLYRMATDVHYRVHHRDGVSDWIVIDQSTPGNEWVYLGEFEFDGDHTQGVLITDEADGFVVADAVKLVHAGGLDDIESQCPCSRENYTE
jgi:hypothetical protein